MKFSGDPEAFLKKIKGTPYVGCPHSGRRTLSSLAPRLKMNTHVRENSHSKDINVI
jgi:hypothetical protein